jgi:hypothetical protein
LAVLIIFLSSFDLDGLTFLEAAVGTYFWISSEVVETCCLQVTKPFRLPPHLSVDCVACKSAVGNILTMFTSLTSRWRKGGRAGKPDTGKKYPSVRYFYFNIFYLIASAAFWNYFLLY